jgi:hypothetical protein
MVGRMRSEAASKKEPSAIRLVAEGCLVRDLGLEPRTQGLRIPCSTN